MSGIIPLALPGGGHGGAQFPCRDLILFSAFVVVLGTLVLQGLTLRALNAAPAARRRKRV
jgi:CPA1 family monovalent cation:H+ antiporter